MNEAVSLEKLAVLGKVLTKSNLSNDAHWLRGWSDEHPWPSWKMVGIWIQTRMQLFAKDKSCRVLGCKFYTCLAFKARVTVVYVVIFRFWEPISGGIFGLNQPDFGPTRISASHSFESPKKITLRNQPVIEKPAKKVESYSIWHVKFSSEGVFTLLEGPSTVFCVAVTACTVVMRPSTIPKLSWITLAKGARQLVVQLALDTTWQ